MARKLYAYVRKSQEGTPMANLIRSAEGKKIEAANNAGPRAHRLSNTQAKPRSKKWTGITNKGTKGSAIKKYMNKNGVGRGAAKGALKDQHTISFAADPKRR